MKTKINQRPIAADPTTFLQLPLSLSGKNSVKKFLDPDRVRISTKSNGLLLVRHPNTQGNFRRIRQFLELSAYWCNCSYPTR